MLDVFEDIGGRESIAMLLLEAGAGIDNVDDEGKTALFHAANLGYLGLLRLLLFWGADCYIKAIKNRTPLHAAAEKGHSTIVQCLFEKKIFEVDCKDQADETPLTLAARGTSVAHANVVRNLLENGANAHIKIFGLHTLIFFAVECGNDTSMQYILKDPRVDPDERNIDKLTPLVIAAKNGHENAILMLFEHSAKSIGNNHSYNRTPLSWAADYGLEKAVRRILEFENVEIGNIGKDGWTPLS
jgi:ankyrin repeat protein